jgi:hypothetical protein
MSSLGGIRKRIRTPIQATPIKTEPDNTWIDEIIEEVRAEAGATTKVPPHPQKYPKHTNPEKGSVFGGICNRTACDEFPALFYNRGTFGYYCVPCGRAINGRDPKPLCERVDHDLSHQEMDERYRA